MLYFISDEHFGHSNILKYCNRPFKNVFEMNNVLIKNFNKKVKKDDLCYHLGDFCFRSINSKGNGEKIKAKDYIKKLNGEHIFIEGNHDFDGRNSLKTRNQEIILRIANIRVQLIHDPEFAKVDYPLVLHGHVHEKWLCKELKYCGKKSLLINVSVDVWDFKPILWPQIQTIYDRWKAGWKIEKLNKF